MGGALDFDRAFERTSMMQRVTWGKPKSRLAKAGTNGMTDYSIQSWCPERLGSELYWCRILGVECRLVSYTNETFQASPQSNARSHWARITLRKEISISEQAGRMRKLSSEALKHLGRRCEPRAGGTSFALLPSGMKTWFCKTMMCFLFLFILLGFV